MMTPACSGNTLGALITGLLLLLGSTISLLAQESESSQQADPDEVIFIPPTIGAPADRVGAATRDVGQEAGVLDLLVPAGGGVTALGKPPLIWHLAENFSGQMSAQLAPIGSPQNGVGISGNGRFRKGFYALDLSRSEFVLEPGSIYVWTVVLAEPEAGTVIATVTNYVERVAAPEPAAEDVSALAAEGFWFDALRPFVEIELSGKVRVNRNAGFASLVRSAGILLP